MGSMHMAAIDDDPYASPAVINADLGPAIHFDALRTLVHTRYRAALDHNTGLFHDHRLSHDDRLFNDNRTLDHDRLLDHDGPRASGNDSNMPSVPAGMFRIAEGHSAVFATGADKRQAAQCYEREHSKFHIHTSMFKLHYPASSRLGRT